MRWPASTKSAQRVFLAAALFACRRSEGGGADAGATATEGGTATATATTTSTATTTATSTATTTATSTATTTATSTATTLGTGDTGDEGGELIELAVPGYRAAFVSVPSGSAVARPVVVATHGVGDRPDWQCNEWRRLVGNRAWVLCPRGIVSERWSTPGDTRWTWHGPPYMKKEIDAGLDALAARFGARVDATGMVYGGFSYGAANGVGIAAKEPTRFPYVVLTEGGGDRWTLDLAKDFVKGGGKRVLFVCGQASCVTEAERTAEMIRRAGVETRVEYGRGEGHGYGGAVAERIRESWSWVTVGDPRWNLGTGPGASRDP